MLIGWLISTSTNLEKKIEIFSATQKQGRMSYKNHTSKKIRLHQFFLELTEILLLSVAIKKKKPNPEQGNLE